MGQKSYDLMDWAGVEELVYSGASNPRAMLGPHLTEEGLLIQVLVSIAAGISIKVSSTGKKHPMELADGADFFVALVLRKSKTPCTLVVTYDSGVTEELYDSYPFAPQYREEDLKKFAASIHYAIYEKVSAYPMTINGVSGVYFSVQAPCAMCVSMVGDLNLWGGGHHQMYRLGEGDGSMFELLIPGLHEGEIYKYGVKTRAGDSVLKTDLYASYAEPRPSNASIVWGVDKYKWNDKSWMSQRAKTGTKDKPMNIYGVRLGSWIRKETVKDETGKNLVGSEFYNYHELTPRLAEYVKDMGYIHVELMPVMEHPLDKSWDYQATGYYVPTNRYGAPEDFMYFMDYMYGQGIGVIPNWVSAHFPRDAYGMTVFDGTCVYGHMDPRKGSHPHWGTLICNYGRPGISNFLIASALFWVSKYHADGIRVDVVASTLYLDYGKGDGEWVPNLYGGNENLEVMELLKHLNLVFEGRKGGTVIIAEESTVWSMITGGPREGGLGFNYRWNMGWVNDLTSYMKCDPLFRENNYRELTFSMLYAYSEDSVLVFSHDEMVHGKGSMIGKMPDEILERKVENLRAAYAFMTGHSGKELLFMGQEYAQMAKQNEGVSLEWGLLEYPVHKNMRDYMRMLNGLYREHPTLYEMGYDPDGFERINCNYQNEGIIIFLRKSRGSKETPLFIYNFDNMEHEKFRVEVPSYGKYKEIFNTDSRDFDGEGRVNGRAKMPRKLEWDGKGNSIEVCIPPVNASIYACTQAEEAVKSEAKKPGVEKGTDKKPTDGKPTARKEVSGKTASPKKVDTVAQEAEMAAAAKDGQKQVAASGVGQGQTNTSKEEQRQIGMSREEQKQTGTSGEGQKRTDASEKEQKQVSTSKKKQERIGTSKKEQKQISTSEKEQRQISTFREEQKRITTSREEKKQISISKKSRKQVGTAKKDQKQITAPKPEDSKTK